MKVELNANFMGFFVVSLVAIACIGVGYAGAYEQAKTITTTQPQFALSETDLNKIAALSYIGGHCERLGLASSVIVQTDQNGNAWGVPVCVEWKKNG
jgi:hypothetical protein